MSAKKQEKTKRKRQYLFQMFEQQWTCPITSIPIIQPAITSDGHTYEKSQITKWLKKQKTSPKTGLILPTQKILPNLALKNVIQKFDKQIKYEIEKILGQNKQHEEKISQLQKKVNQLQGQLQGERQRNLQLQGIIDEYKRDEQQQQKDCRRNQLSSRRKKSGNQSQSQQSQASIFDSSSSSSSSEIEQQEKKNENSNRQKNAKQRQKKKRRRYYNYYNSSSDSDYVIKQEDNNDNDKNIQKQSNLGQQKNQQKNSYSLRSRRKYRIINQRHHHQNDNDNNSIDNKRQQQSNQQQQKQQLKQQSHRIKNINNNNKIISTISNQNSQKDKLLPFNKYLLKNPVLYDQIQHSLDHSHIEIDINQFLKYDWSQLKSLNLDSTEIGNSQLEQLSQVISNTNNLMKLQTIVLANNYIIEINKQSMEKICQLKKVINQVNLIEQKREKEQSQGRKLGQNLSCHMSKRTTNMNHLNHHQNLMNHKNIKGLKSNRSTKNNKSNKNNKNIQKINNTSNNSKKTQQQQCQIY